MCWHGDELDEDSSEVKFGWFVIVCDSDCDSSWFDVLCPIVSQMVSTKLVKFSHLRLS